MEIEYAESYLAGDEGEIRGEPRVRDRRPPRDEADRRPRLILQPFIENCFKYGTTARPPWRIELRGHCADGRWSIEILDNGPGFAAETLARISERLAARRQAGSGLSPMSISGMGIVNSYERLRLAFGDEAAFEITNRPDGGARIAMGAGLHG